MVYIPLDNDEVAPIEATPASAAAADGGVDMNRRRLVLGIAMALDSLADRLHDVSDQLVDLAYNLPGDDSSQSAAQTARRDRSR